MAAADTARLVAELTLNAKGFSSGVNKAQKDLGKLESTAFRVGQNIGGGLKSAASNLAKIGVVAAGGIAVAVKGGLDDLAELETAVTSVDGAISQLGLTGQVTGAQIATWANDIERDVQAAFDDKAITAAAATLIRFGKVTPKNLKQALVVMTDLAAKTGDVESASTLLAKALADPAKAAGKLAKQGVILTDAQQDTIKAMVEVNDIAGAQQVILDALAKTTGGAAAASQGKYNDAINILGDVSEDAKKALAEGFLPVIERVADRLSTAVGDPKFIAGIREFGNTLAGGLDDLISIAEKLPWGTIGESLRIAGVGAKAVLTAFTSLPPWVQTAVLTGWGLNKLTGGALGGIVGELGKGLIKGVLGINAGVVHVNGPVAGGPGGVTGGKGGGGIGGLIGAGVKIALPAALFVGVSEGIGQFLEQRFGQAGAAAQNAAQLALPANFLQTFKTISDKVDELVNPTKVQNQHLADMKQKLSDSAVRDTANGERLEAIKTAQAAGAAKIAAEMPPIRSEMIGVRQGVAAAKAQFATDSSSERASIARAASQQAAAQARTTEAARSAAAAIRDKDMSVSVYNNLSVSTSVSVRDDITAHNNFKSVYRVAQ
jgi:hypothetical protein